MFCEAGYLDTLEIWMSTRDKLSLRDYENDIEAVVHGPASWSTELDQIRTGCQKSVCAVKRQ